MKTKNYDYPLGKLILIIPIVLLNALSAQESSQQEKTRISYPISFSISKSAVELSNEQKTKKSIDNEEMELEERHTIVPIKNRHTAEDGPEWGNDQTTIQKTMGTRAGNPPLTDWLGEVKGIPPDPSGAAGPNHYVQSVNKAWISVFDKQTGANLASFSLANLWNPATPSWGDATVMYDKTADRWIIAQLEAYTEKIHMAVSQTPDPTGQYYTYTFNTGTTTNPYSTSLNFPDYLKFSIWHDGYYMTANWINSSLQTGVWVLERSAMLAGSPTARIASKLWSAPAGVTLGFFCPLTGFADGQLPTTGPCPLVFPVDNGWNATADGVYIKQITTVWGNTPSVSISQGSLIPTLSHDLSECNTNGEDIPQPGTPTKLMSLTGMATYRAQWRKWPNYNTLVLAFEVKISSTQRAFKWVELRQNGSTWSKYQEGVFNPDAHSRWLPSIAMNDNGDIGISYARSSSSLVDGYPSCGYVGRCKNDPLGQLSIAETIVPGGTGGASQTNVNRFGDYGHTSLDPSNGTIFWATQEYIDSVLNSSSLGYHYGSTRIWSFQLACPTTGIDESGNNIASYNIYQNNNIINVECANLISNENTHVDLFDITGKEISNQIAKPQSNSIKTTINATGLSTGVYFVRIGNDDYQNVVKIFIK